LSETRGETTDRSQSVRKIIGWEVFNNRLLGTIDYPLGIEDGVPFDEDFDSVIVTSYLETPYTGSATEDEIPLHEGVEIETPKSRYRLGQEYQDLGEAATLFANDNQRVLQFIL
jgi:hypothetical protein